MSKLFEAISQIENSSSESAVEIPFKAPQQNGRGLDQAHRRILYLIGLLTLIGLIVALFTKYKLNYSQPQYTKQKLNIAINTKKQSTTNTTITTKNNIISHNKISKKTDNIHDIKRNKFIENKTIKAKQNKRDIKKNIKTPKHLLNKKQIAKKAYNKTKPHNPYILTFRQKKLLYQAERLRKQGDINTALKLYDKIWQEIKNPLVANNLAALLMEKGHYKKAEKILKKALTIKPKDEDLNYNLSLVTSYLKTQESLKK